jgi:hypothetical protein
LPARENTVPQWALKLGSILAAEENWHLKGCTVKVNNSKAHNEA